MPRLRIAQFGAGRIGAYHFKNMLVNEHASLSHLVEVDTKRAAELVDKYHMQDLVRVVHMDQSSDVLNDPKLVHACRKLYRPRLRIQDVWMYSNGDKLLFRQIFLLCFLELML